MRRGARVVILVGGFFILIMCSGGGQKTTGCGTESPTSPTSPNSSVTGTVTNILTNQPVAGATVTVSPTGFSTTITTTPANGSFTVNGIGAVSTRIEARATGYRDFATTVALMPGGNTVNIQMVPAP